MASYPGSIFNPTPINTGDTGQPAQINDAYAELTAIETALVTGPIQLPNSSLTALSVTGGSTVNTLQVNGASTFAGAVTMAGAVTITGTLTLPRVPTCKVGLSTSIAIPADTFTGLNWNQQDINSTAMHSTGTNSSRIALTSAGVWAVGAQIEWTGNASASHFVRLRLSDTNTIAGVSNAIENVDPHVQMVEGIYLATSTSDYVTVQVRSKDSTGTVNASSTLTGGCAFWAYKVSN